MARITNLTETTVLADGDWEVGVDISDTTQSAQGSTRKNLRSTAHAYYNTHPAQAVTLAAAATTIAVTSQFVTVTGDAGANTVSTITGARTGVPYVFLFVDALVTITDTNGHTADTVDLIAPFVSADDSLLTLIYDGTSWYEISRTVDRIQSVTLAAAATTIVVNSQFVIVTGDAGANTVATITGGAPGIPYTLLFVDALVTITDTDAHTADTIDLAGAATNLTSADDTTLTLIFDGTSWYEISRSVN